MTEDVITPAMTEVLSAVPNVMIAVGTKAGPRVTPELFTFAGGRLWCLTAASTVKAKVLRDGGRVAVAASAGDRTVVVLGEAIVLDAVRPLRSALHPRVTAAAPLAMRQFAVDNAAELTGAAVDMFAGRLGTIPPRRVILSVEADAAALLDGDAITETSGSTQTREHIEEGPPEDGDFDLVDAFPEGLRSLADDGPAFLGWTTGGGDPLALPAAWRAQASHAVVAGELLRWAGGATRSPACVTREAWTGFGPSGKQGVMLRGHGTAGVDNGTATVVLDIDGVTYWDGVETGRASSDGAG